MDFGLLCAAVGEKPVGIGWGTAEFDPGRGLGGGKNGRVGWIGESGFKGIGGRGR